MVDFYAVLEVEKGATQEQIKRNYHRLALRYHPDKAGPDGAARFKEVSTAYEVLSNKRKKDIYDRYGEAGLDALENPVAGAAFSTFGSTVPVLVAIGTLFLYAVMLLLFLVFLVAFVDGRLPTWNYAKVFSPLFVLDFLVGIPALILLGVFLIMSPLSLHVHCMLLSLLCAVALTIVIPIAKDRSEARAGAGRTDIKWRVWLIPGYLCSAFAFIAIVLVSFPTESRILTLKSIGLVRLANYARVSFVFALVQGCCIVAFFALVACRADEVITTNYFIVVGLPVFLLLTLFLVNRFVLSLLSGYISDVPPEVAAAAAARELNANGGEAPVHDSNENGNDVPHPSRCGSCNPMSNGAVEGRDCANPQARAELEEEFYPTESHAHNSHHGNENDNDRREQQGESNGKNPYAGQHSSVCGILASMITSIIVVGLLIASTAMIAVRLNHFYINRTYDGVLSLTNACIPLFIILSAVVLSMLNGCLMFCCCSAFMAAKGPMSEADHGNQQDEKEESDVELQDNVHTDRTQLADEAVPGMPPNNRGTTGRPAAVGSATSFSAAPATVDGRAQTPLDRHPDSTRLSDVD
ncbi:putative DnaJ domain containing protein [Leishmania naiffi]|uniref:DnaJ domain containing protein n=1 Tax=Leishmania naiffi TaxID=5678 RepID=A0AAW3BBJ4_9TRYP